MIRVRRRVVRTLDSSGLPSGDPSGPERETAGRYDLDARAPARHAARCAVVMAMTRVAVIAPSAVAGVSGAGVAAQSSCQPGLPCASRALRLGRATFSTTSS